ncbi:GDSL-type esterase/lipase family protein [Streptomyces sp. NBC_01433]|uniref:GDSL-type esterase/lipase family protein n=1 Tax=Streptomyces sp. NBC_01433 TaxID=2903864 RepID=UPI002254FCFC|nr:GDSL-type esterase/lipase family protein [Streptomyces sp. NBC_01433]MCX4681160.1 GDSL-type esterase/lipase family protein [Streptomyces sp. NBC_01433]
MTADDLSLPGPCPLPGRRTRPIARTAIGGAVRPRSVRLSGIEVVGFEQRDGIVAFGDSITDGDGSTVDANRRYPDRLADRLITLRRPAPVLNEGPSGNRLLTDDPLRGDGGLTRFGRDVPRQPGIGTVILLEGINDINFAGVLQEPANPARLKPSYDSRDHMHPNDAGYHAMANAIDLDDLT